LSVWGLELRVEGLGFRVEGLGFRVQGLGWRVQGLKIDLPVAMTTLAMAAGGCCWFRVQDSGPHSGTNGASDGVRWVDRAAVGRIGVKVGRIGRQLEE
jgi:hypothetical protein